MVHESLLEEDNADEGEALLGASEKVWSLYVRRTYCCVLVGVVLYVSRLVYCCKQAFCFFVISCEQALCDSCTCMYHTWAGFFVIVVRICKQVFCYGRICVSRRFCDSCKQVFLW